MKNNRTKTLEAHPLGGLFPSMDDESYKTLKASIKSKGFDPQEPIILHEGKILDGNHRYTAAKSLKITPPTKKYEGDDPIGYVIQKNLARRHMTASQAATVAAELAIKMKEADKALREEAKAAKKQGKKTAPMKRSDKVAKASKALNVSERQTAKAKKLRETNPEEFEEVKKGKKSLNKAVKSSEAKKSSEQRKTEEYELAAGRIDSVCGEGFSLIAAKKLLSKQIMELSNLDKDEMLRVKPYIEAGWSLKAALGYKSTALTYAHNIRQLTDRAIGQGGKFTLEIDDWVINVSKK